MKKTILTIMVAAMMLVAFTACEQQVPDLNGQVPTNAIITQTGTFVEGQMFDPTQFSVKLTYKNGYTETVSGANLVTLDSEKAYVMPGDTVSVNVTTVGGTSNGQQMIGNAQLNVKTIDSVTVVAPETLDAPVDVTSTAVKSLFTVTANYDGGSIVVKPSEFVINGMVNTVTPDTGDTLTNSAVFVSVKLASDEVVATSDKFSVKIVDPDEEPKEEVNEWTGKIGYAVTPASNSVVYVQRGLFDADAMVTLYKQIDRYGDGSELYYEELVPGTNEKLTITLAADLANTPENEIRFEEKATATVNFSYEYVEDEATGKLATITQADTSDIVGSITFEDSEDGTIEQAATTITISDIISDYATAISATWNGKGGVANTAYEVSNNILAADFDVNITWKSGYDVDLVGVSFTVNPSTAPSLETADNNYPVTLTYGTKGYVDQVTTATSYVAIAADPDLSA